MEKIKEKEAYEKEFEMMSTPIGGWIYSKISVGNRHLRTLKFSQDKTKD